MTICFWSCTFHCRLTQAIFSSPTLSGAFSASLVTVIFRETGYFPRADGFLIWKIGVEKEIPFEEPSPPNAIPLYGRKVFFKTYWRGELHLLLALRENECSWEKVGWGEAYLNLWIGFCYWEGDTGEVGRERGREEKSKEKRRGKGWKVRRPSSMKSIVVVVFVVFCLFLFLFFFFNFILF